VVAHAFNHEGVETSETDGLTRMTRHELEGQHAHPNQIRAMDSLERLCDHRPDTEEKRTLGCPVARRSGAVFFARDDHERNSALLVFHRGFVNRNRLVPLASRSPPTCSSRRELVTKADIREGSAHHHLVISPTRSIGVEVDRLHAMLDQPFPGWTRSRNRAGWRDVISSDGITEHSESARPGDRPDSRWSKSHPVEERGILNVSRIQIPGV